VTLEYSWQLIMLIILTLESDLIINFKMRTTCLNRRIIHELKVVPFGLQCTKTELK